MTALSPDEQIRRDELALKFYTACFDGNLEEVKRIVHEGPTDQLDINRVIHGGTAFAAAVQNSHLEVVKYLAALGADMEIPIHDGATPIFIACYRGNMEIVRFLCFQSLLKASFARVAHSLRLASYRRMRTATHHSPLLRNIDVRYIRCSVHESDGAGLDIAEVLLQHGVNIAPVNKKGSTPFFFACQEGNIDVVKFLVRNGADTTIGKNGISPFHMACYRGHLDVVTYLVVDVDVDPHAVDGSGRTPLEVARRAGKEEVIRFLEQLDADKQREYIVFHAATALAPTPVALLHKLSLYEVKDIINLGRNL